MNMKSGFFYSFAMYTTDMKTAFFVILIFALTFVLPAYVVFALAAGLILLNLSPAWWILALGVYLDAAYAFSFPLGSLSIPLYSSIALIATLIIPIISRRLSF